MKIIVSVHGRFHAFELALGLHKHGFLHSLLTTYPEFMVKSIVDGNFPVKTKPYLEFLRRSLDKISFLNSQDLFISCSFGKFAAKHVKNIEEAKLLVGWSSATLEAIKPAQNLGKKIILERGSSHIREPVSYTHLTLPTKRIV